MDLKIPIFDFDNIPEWSPWMDDALKTFDLSYLSSPHSNIRYIEDARNVVANYFGRNELARILFCAFKNFGVRLFHGTRVTEIELRQIREIGLRPLDLQSRRNRLQKIFSMHPDWGTVQQQLDSVLHSYGPDWEKNGHGRREDGCVYFCISRAGLLRGCNHYLKTGSEIDLCIAERLFPDGSGRNLLNNHGEARIISAVVTFREAAEAMDPYGFSTHNLPTLIDCLVSAWAYRKIDSSYQTNCQRCTLAAKISGVVAHTSIEATETVADHVFSHQKT